MDSIPCGLPLMVACRADMSLKLIVVAVLKVPDEQTIEAARSIGLSGQKKPIMKFFPHIG